MGDICFSQPWEGNIHHYRVIGSTNTEAKRLAQAGAPHGTVVIADHQTQGRGRMERSFESPQGLGLYLSAVLRPSCPPEELMHLTCAVGVCACDAVEAVCGIRPGLKWINDLVIGQKKLGGILCELSIDPATGLTDHAIVGIGINCLHSLEQFPPALQGMATSLSMVTGKATEPRVLAQSLIHALSRLDLSPAVMDRYRKDCITLGQAVVVIRGDEKYYATATHVDARGGLVVTLPDGSTRTVSSGEVSVRGMYGYC